MASLKSKDFVSALEKKGFKKSSHSKQKGRRGRGNHHIYYYFYYSGKQTRIKTYVSHGTKEFGDRVISDVKKQMNLSKIELFDFVQCKLTEEMYGKLMIKKQKIKHN